MYEKMTSSISVVPVAFSPGRGGYIGFPLGNEPGSDRAISNQAKCSPANRTSILTVVLVSLTTAINEYLRRI